MASALPLGPRQPQVQAASAGLVNYDQDSRGERPMWQAGLQNPRGRAHCRWSLLWAYSGGLRAHIGAHMSCKHLSWGWEFEL